MIKKNRQSHNHVQLEKKKYPAKPTSRNNQGYIVKLASRVIDSIKFINLVFLNYFLFN
jgi:hypothetical protein